MNGYMSGTLKCGRVCTKFWDSWTPRLVSRRGRIKQRGSMQNGKCWAGGVILIWEYRGHLGPVGVRKPKVMSDLGVDISWEMVKQSWENVAEEGDSKQRGSKAQGGE